MKLMTVAIIGLGAYFVWQSGLLNKFAGGFGGLNLNLGLGRIGGNSANADGADGADANGAPGMPGGIGLPGQAGGYAFGGGSQATVCTNGVCETHTGNNISVSCVDGRCRSNNAYVHSWSY